MNLLIVEDDQCVADFLARALRAEGYGITLARSGTEGFELGRTRGFDLIVLDLVLPGMHGLEVCQELRARRILTPILMLTALDTTEDKIEGLRLGADDYLTKPFDIDELLARIEALLRRSRYFEVRPQQLVVEDLVFDRDSLTVRRGERLIELTAKELALLELLMSTPGRVFSRERILNVVWGYSEDPLTNIIDVYIRKLRSKIDEGEALPLIKTVRGVGYKINKPLPGEE
jgi:DNA-binding response OmpR family regulator